MCRVWAHLGDPLLIDEPLRVGSLRPEGTDDLFLDNRIGIQARGPRDDVTVTGNVIAGNAMAVQGIDLGAGNAVHGNVGESIRCNPVAPIVVPLLAGFVAYACVVYVRHGRWPGASGPGAQRIAIVGVAMWMLLVGVWLARFHGAFGGPVQV